MNGTYHIRCINLLWFLAQKDRCPNKCFRMADSASVEFEDSDVIEIIPAEEYDTHRVSNV